MNSKGLNGTRFNELHISSEFLAVAYCKILGSAISLMLSEIRALLDVAEERYEAAAIDTVDTGHK